MRKLHCTAEQNQAQTTQPRAAALPFRVEQTAKDLLSSEQDCHILRTKIATDDIWSWSPHHVHVQATRKPMQNGSPCRPCCARTPNGRHPASLSAGPGATAARIHRRAGAAWQVDLSEELPGLSRLDP